MGQDIWYYPLRKHHKLCEKIRPFTQPLLETFQLAQFSYFFVDSKGNSACLSSYPEWVEYYLYQNLFLYNPFLKHPSLIPEGVFLSRGMKDQGYLATRQHSESFGIDDSITIIFKDDERLRGFSFGVKKNESTCSLLMNEIPLLKNFCMHFEKEAKFSILELEPVNVLPFLGQKFDCPKENFVLSTTQRTQFLSQIGVKNPKLTPREKQCLLLYLQGETAKGIGTLLNLSSRTVESYIDHTKIKLNCFKKTDLLKKAQNLLNSGLIAP